MPLLCINACLKKVLPSLGRQPPRFRAFFSSAAFAPQSRPVARGCREAMRALAVPAMAAAYSFDDEHSYLTCRCGKRFKFAGLGKHVAFGTCKVVPPAVYVFPAMNDVRRAEVAVQEADRRRQAAQARASHLYASDLRCLRRQCAALNIALKNALP